jgi:rhamnulokinase
MSALAAVDLGAQSGRVALGRFDGARLTVSEAYRFPNGPIEEDGGLVWDAERIFGGVLEGLARAAGEAEAVDCVGVDAWGVDFGLLDGAGRLVRNPVHYRDARRAQAFATVLDRVPAREIYERTGIQLMPINTLFELAGMVAEDDPALATAQTLLLIPDLLHHLLCGTRTTELTNATTTQCLDARTRGWAHDLLGSLGIPLRVLPEVVPPGTVLGPVLPEVAESTGLGAASVVAVATHDTASAVAAVPFRAPGSAYISAGTWSLVGLELTEPRIDDATFAANLTNEGGIAGTFRLLRNVTGLWLLHECRRAWEREGLAVEYDRLVALADEAPPLRSLIDPDDPRFAQPGDMPARVRAFCRETGQEAPQTPAQVVRCVLESLALAHARVIGKLRAAAGADPVEIHVVGGGARNERLCRWTAHAAGLPVLAGPEEATLVGNMLGQALAIGELASLGEAREVVRASFAPRVYEPSASAGWDEAGQRFSELSAAPAAEEPA